MFKELCGFIISNTVQLSVFSISLGYLGIYMEAFQSTNGLNATSVHLWKPCLATEVDLFVSILLISGLGLIMSCNLFLLDVIFFFQFYRFQVYS